MSAMHSAPILISFQYSHFLTYLLSYSLQQQICSPFPYRQRIVPSMSILVPSQNYFRRPSIFRAHVLSFSFLTKFPKMAENTIELLLKIATRVCIYITSSYLGSIVCGMGFNHALMQVPMCAREKKTLYEEKYFVLPHMRQKELLVERHETVNFCDDFLK